MSAWAHAHPYLSFFLILGLMQAVVAIVAHLTGHGDCD